MRHSAGGRRSYLGVGMRSGRSVPSTAPVVTSYPGIQLQLAPLRSIPAVRGVVEQPLTDRMAMVPCARPPFDACMERQRNVTWHGNRSKGIDDTMVQ